MENIYKWMITRGTTMDWKPPNDGSAVFIVPQKWWSYPGLFYPHSHDPPVIFFYIIMGTLTISMAIFNSYVCLPEGMPVSKTGLEPPLQYSPSGPAVGWRMALSLFSTVRRRSLQPDEATIRRCHRGRCLCVSW